MVCVNYIYDMVANTQFHKFYGRPIYSDNNSSPDVITFTRTVIFLLL